jgi:hypothetical protein
VIEYDGSVISVEVMAGNTATVSLNLFIDEYDFKPAFKVKKYCLFDRKGFIIIKSNLGT